MDVDFNNESFDQNLKKLESDDENSKRRKRRKRKKKKGKEEPILSKFPKEIQPPSSITAFFASDINQLSYDSKESPNSIFTYYLLQGLKGAADNGDKEITVSELHDFVNKNVKDKTTQLYKDLPKLHCYTHLIQIEYYIDYLDVKNIEDDFFFFAKYLP